MSIYRVVIEETHSKTVEIEADSPEEAIEKAGHIIDCKFTDADYLEDSFRARIESEDWEGAPIL